MLNTEILGLPVKIGLILNMTLFKSNLSLFYLKKENCKLDDMINDATVFKVFFTNEATLRQK